MALIESTCPLSVPRHLVRSMSQSFAVWSMLHDATKSPLSWYATPQTACAWSESVATHLLFAKSQSFTVPSPDDVASVAAFGWKSMQETQLLWPSPVRMRSPLGMLHIFQVWSSEAVAMMLFFGCSASAEIGAICALYVLRSSYLSARCGSNERFR